MWMQKGNGSGMWHLAQRREMRGDKSGTVFSEYFVTACRGNALYDPYAKPTLVEAKPSASVCKRCAAAVIVKIATEFANGLRSIASEAEWDTMRERNSHADDGTCASHDFCDANMVMMAAMAENGYDCEGDPDEAGWGKVWNAAWRLAKAEMLTRPHGE